ncbi:hypothetical protein Q6335_26700, partial [Klebsiella pneumoniae]|nr:hypothetical protein [Klebsiella pneumoniae]
EYHRPSQRGKHHRESATARSSARFADRIAVLRQGRLYASGKADDVLDPLLFAEVYRVQVRIERCSQQSLPVLRTTPSGRA